MSREGNGGVLSYERVLAWIAAFLLTVFLVCCLFSSALVQVITSAGLHIAAATDDSVLDDQMRSIYEYIDLMSVEYGFHADDVKAAVSRHEMDEFNREAASWWTRALTEGESGSIPRWNSSALEEAVSNAMAGDERKEDSRAAAAEITDKINRTVFPLREAMLTTGLDFVNDRADISGIIRSLKHFPLLCLSVCILAAGLIALLTGHKIFLSLKYYGTALASAALVLVTAGATFFAMQLKDMLAQASSSMAGAFGALTKTLFLEAGSAALVLLISGFACLFIYRNRFEKHCHTVEDQTV